MFRRAVQFRERCLSGRISVGLKRVPVGCNLQSRGGSVMESSRKDKIMPGGKDGIVGKALDCVRRARWLLPSQLHTLAS